MASKTDMAILGMLSIEPMSGYDMKQFCERSLSFFWYESYGNLYPRLKQLSKNGYIQGRKEPSDKGPDAIVYSLTGMGQSHLQEWLEEPSGREHVRSEFMLKFFFGSHVPVEIVATRLFEYEQQQRDLQKHFKEIAQTIQMAAGESPDVMFWQMSLRRGQLLTNARLRWSRECRVQIESLKRKRGSQ